MSKYNFISPPKKLTLANDIFISYSNWSLSKGTKVDVEYEISESYYGKMSGNFYPAKINMVKILDCKYPIVWFPRNFVEFENMENIYVVV